MYTIEYALSTEKEVEEVVDIALYPPRLHPKLAVLLARTFVRLTLPHMRDDPYEQERPPGVLRRKLEIWDESVAWLCYKAMANATALSDDSRYVSWTCSHVLFTPKGPVEVMLLGDEMEQLGDPTPTPKTGLGWSLDDFAKDESYPPFVCQEGKWMYNSQPFEGKVVTAKEASRELVAWGLESGSVGIVQGEKIG